MTIEDAELMAQLIEIADRQFDGHLTVMKFTTNWRVGFGTPGDGYGQEVEMSAGKTFADAARTALANPQRVNCVGASQKR